MINVKKLAVNFYNSETKNWVEAVHEVNFNLDAGRVLGIVGESGSGKSVSSFSIMRLHDETTSSITGEINFHNVNLLKLNPSELRKLRGRKIAMIFQEPMTSLNPVLTCGYQVMEAIQWHLKLDKKAAQTKTLALFREVQLPRPEDIFKAYPHQISGGQKQRVMIAMALSCDPELLIADEPTTALDVTVQKTILDLLLKIKKERNMALIFISHDLGIMTDIADDLVVMYKGNVVEQGPAIQIFLNPRDAYTKGLLACRPQPNIVRKKLPVVADFLAGREEYFNSSANIYTASEIEVRRTALYTQNPLLQVNNLNVWYPIKNKWYNREKQYVKAVHDVSFKVYPGETLGLVGESGCGKTTLGRALLRLIDPHSGEINFNGKNVLSLPKSEMKSLRRHMQLIFQDPYSSLNPRITVGDAILEPLEVHGLYHGKAERKAAVLDLLAQVGLEATHYNRYPHEFSGGQRQRIVIARALALKPKFLICDESVSALDVSVQAQVLNLLKDLQASLGLTYIFISHDLAVVKHISDRMLVMNKGKIEELDFPEKIYLTPKADYTKRLIAAIPGNNEQLHTYGKN
ncbi:MAG: ABC transporter ATP-binding protein [Pedobacter sp.]|nr:MAG: ABC transporter ATP-binding protein [Pedobacter sp.]